MTVQRVRFDYLGKLLDIVAQVEQKQVGVEVNSVNKSDYIVKAPVGCLHRVVWHRNADDKFLPQPDVLEILHDLVDGIPVARKLLSLCRFPR